MQNSKLAPGAIDTHAHVYPSGYLDRLESIGIDPATTKIARGMAADATDDDMATRLEWMDKAGVGVQVLAVTPQAPCGPKPDSSLDAARAVNDEYVRILQAHPDRFLAYAALPLPHAKESVAELERLDDAPFVGVSFPALLPGGGSIADRSLDDVWAALDERHAVVNIHPTGSGACAAPISDHGLGWVNGAPVEDATATLQLLKADIPGRFPNVRVHVCHLGGDLPFLFQRIEDNYADWGAFERSPQESLRRMWFDAANFYEPALRLAVEAYGTGRVMAGSDHPYFQQDKYVRAFDYIRSSTLPSSEIDAILAGTARALYGLDDEPRA